jgi:cytochrome P450
MSKTGQAREGLAQIMVRLGTRSVKRAYVELMANRRIERHRGVVNVYRSEDVIAASHDTRLYGPGAFGPSFGARRPLIPMDLEGADHGRYLRLLAPLFAPKAVARARERTRQLAAELIRGFAGDGEVELVERYCRPVGSLGFLDLYGLPREDYPYLQRFVDNVVRPQGRTPQEQTAAAHEAGDAVYGYLLDRIRDARRSGGDDRTVLGDLVNATVDDRPLTDEELQDISYLLVIAGIEMVPTALSCIFAWLAENPEAADRLVGDPDLVPGAVEELLRYETPTPSAVRRVTHDVELPGGDVLTEGEQVRLVWASANLDEQAVPAPLDVDFARQQRMNLAFGSGHHRCIGAPLSRMQLTVAVSEFHRHIPRYRIDPTEPPLYFDFGIRKKLPLRFAPGAAGSASG